MLIAGITGIDFNPPSVEKYTNEINQQNDVLNKLTPGNNIVYWTKDGNKYHIYQECQHIKGKNDITQGTIKESFDKKGISELCLTCQSKAMKEKNISSGDLINKIKTVVAADSAQ
jgi:nitrite reductase/ring-hydroxylating ferredoxin subunit